MKLRSKRTLSILLTLALLASLLPVMAAPAAALAGDGTAAKPYRIGTAADLKEFRDIVNGTHATVEKNTGACAVLTADIDLEGEAWTPICTDKKHPYTGHFDGKGKEITNLTVNLTGNYNYAGFFGCIGRDGVAENLTLSGSVNVSGNMGDLSVGGVAGQNDGTIRDCAWSGPVTGEDDRFNSYVGGVVGSNAGVVADCWSSGNVTAKGKEPFAGGIVGINSSSYDYTILIDGALLNCYHFTGTVTGDGNTAHVGGVAGRNTVNTVTACYWLDGTAVQGIGDNYYGVTAEATALTADQFKVAANFTGWDFQLVWKMGADAPVLRGSEGTPREPETWSKLYSALQLGGYIELAKDVKFGTGGGDHASSALTVPAGVTATLDLNGHIVDRNLNAAAENGSVLTVSGNLTLTDSAPTQAHDPAVTYTDPITTASVTVAGGVLTGGRTSDNGGGVLVAGGGAFTMAGGAICGNSAAHDGGGVYVSRTYSKPVLCGTFTLDGGMICGNTGRWGGGVFVSPKCSFTLDGGVICGNTADGNGDPSDAYGGGVRVDQGTFTMTGGAIRGNRSDKNAGGVCTYMATCTMTGGEISGNYAVKEAGGLSVGDSTSFEMAGGAIRGNTAGNATGGIGINNFQTTFTVSGDAVVAENRSGTGQSVKTENIHLQAGQVITITGELTDTASFGVTLPAVFGITPFTDGWNANMYGKDVTKYFTSDDAAFQVALNGGEAALTTTRYIVAFDAGGGTPKPASQPVADGGKVAEPPVPRYAGHDFEGWYNGDEPWDFANGTVTSDGLTLKAKWAQLPALTLGTDALGADANTANAQLVRFGGLSWYVIAYDGKDGDGNALRYTPNGATAPVDLYPTGTATLLAAATDASGQFNESRTGNADYASSDLKQRIGGDNGLLSGLSAAEQAAVKSRTLEGGGGTYGDGAYDSNKIQGETVENALLWPLSVAEADQMTDILRNAIAHDPYYESWWLRTPGVNPENAAFVQGENGKVNRVGEQVWYGDWNEDHPACYLDLDAVLFLSDTSVKTAGAVGTLSAVGDFSGNEWKLTVADDAHSDFSAVCTDDSEGVWTVTYSGAASGEKEYVSAVIVNSDGAVTYFGRLALAAAGNNKTVTVDVGDKLGEGDTLYVFNEQCNGDNETDYASPLQELVLPYHVDITASAHMSTTGDASQAVLVGEDMVDVVYTAADGYYFPTTYSVEAVNGVSVTRDSDTQLTVSGTPTADAAIALPAPTANGYSVQFDGNGATGGSMSAQAFTYDAAQALTANAFARKDYDFSGWNTAADGSGDGYADGATVSNLTAVDGATVTLYAQWTKQGTVAAPGFTPGAGTYVGVQSVTITCATEGSTVYYIANDTEPAIVYTAPIEVAETTTLTAWAVKAGMIGSAEVTAEYVITAPTPTEYTVTVTDDGNGTGAASPASGVSGTEVTLTATAGEGYHFKEWQVISGGVTVTDNKLTIGTANVEIKAVFEADSPAPYYDDTPAASGSIVTIPAANGAPALKVNVSGGAATVEALTDTQIAAIARSDAPTVDVLFDLSSLGDKITDVSIPAETFVRLAAALAAHEGADTVTIRTAQGGLRFDEAALAAIVQNATGGTVELHLMFTAGAAALEALNPAQRSALADKNAVGVAQISLKVGGKEIHDFKGGRAAVSLPFAPKNGTEGRDHRLWYVSPDGALEPQPTNYQSESEQLRSVIRHNSDYVVLHELLPFRDVDRDDWYYDAVQCSFTNLWFNGTAEGVFSPDGAMTRAMFTTVLWRFAFEPQAETACDFTDVAAGSWYAAAVAWASENGIVTGYGDGTFGVNDPVTREQIAAMLYRYAKLQGQGFTGMWYFPLDFPDAGEVADWADEAMHWLVMQGVINGMDGALQPRGGATRAQVAAVLRRTAALTKG